MKYSSKINITSLLHFEMGRIKMKKSNKKNKEIKIRVTESFFNEVHEVTDNVSEYARQAIVDSISRDTYSSNPTYGIQIKEIDLIIEAKKSQINIYKQILERERKEISELETQKKLIQKQIEDDAANVQKRIDRLLVNPKFISEMDENINLLLRKKYLHVDISINNTFNQRAELGQLSVHEYKSMLKEYFEKEYYVGRVIRISSEKEITLTDADMDYIKRIL